MSSNSEVGNLKNVTNFGTLISFATGYGATYAPSNTAILLTALTTKKTTAESNLDLIKDTEIPLNKQRGIRKALFEPLQPLATRVVSVFPFFWIEFHIAIFNSVYSTFTHVVYVNEPLF